MAEGLDQMTSNERQEEPGRRLADLRRLRQELEGITSDVKALRQDIAEIRGLLSEQVRRAEPMTSKRP
jgi:prefoldin subunit 5